MQKHANVKWSGLLCALVLLVGAFSLMGQGQPRAVRVVSDLPLSGFLEGVAVFETADGLVALAGTLVETGKTADPDGKEIGIVVFRDPGEPTPWPKTSRFLFVTAKGDFSLSVLTPVQEN